MTRLTAKMYGSVQGVFFREKAKQKAQNLGLTGFSRNLSDGTVKIVAEGDEESLEQLLDWCHVGPELAKVEKVESFWGNSTGEFKDFEIE